MQQTPHILCICGKPASGKSTFRKMLKELGWNTLETSEIIAEMLATKNVRELTGLEQARYRKSALELVSGPRPQALSNELLLRISKMNRPIVISGIRNVSTLFDLSETGVDLIILFMDTSYLTCIDRFVARGGERAGYQNLMSDPIESEWPKIYDRSNERVPNNGSIDELRKRANALHNKFFPLCA
ncbi:MAG: hypothetical protein P1P90_04550 [Patescibacteria group bacterium]|nr:hypothetical protein [Patescibacteria group bacterium]